MTNHPSGHRFRNLVGGMPPEPPGGHIMIGARPPPPPPIPLMQVIGNMADTLVQGRDLMAVVATMRDGPDAATPDALHVIAVVEAFAVAQATVKGLHEANQARIAQDIFKATAKASGVIEVPDSPPAPNGHAEGGA